MVPSKDTTLVEGAQGQGTEEEQLQGTEGMQWHVLHGEEGTLQSRLVVPARPSLPESSHRESQGAAQMARNGRANLITPLPRTPE